MVLLLSSHYFVSVVLTLYALKKKKKMNKSKYDAKHLLLL